MRFPSLSILFITRSTEDLVSLPRLGKVAPSGSEETDEVPRSP